MLKIESGSFPENLVGMYQNTRCQTAPAAVWQIISTTHWMSPRSLGLYYLFDFQAGEPQ
jgi:hypothetical protein